MLPSYKAQNNIIVLGSCSEVINEDYFSMYHAQHKLEDGRGKVNYICEENKKKKLQCYISQKHGEI